MEFFSAAFWGFFGILGGLFIFVVALCVLIVVVGTLILVFTKPTTATPPPQTPTAPPPTTGGGTTNTPRRNRLHMPSWAVWTLIALVALLILSIFYWKYVLLAWGVLGLIGLKTIFTVLAVIVLVGVVIKFIPSSLRQSAVAVAVLALVGFGAYTYWPSSWSSTYSTPMRIQNAAKSTLCPGELKVVELDAVPKVINPQGRCIVHYRVEGAAVLIDAQGNTLRVDEKPSNNPAFWPEYARSAQKSTVRMHYKLNAS